MGHMTSRDSYCLLVEDGSLNLTLFWIVQFLHDTATVTTPGASYSVVFQSCCQAEHLAVQRSELPTHASEGRLHQLRSSWAAAWSTRLCKTQMAEAKAKGEAWRRKV